MWNAKRKICRSLIGLHSGDCRDLKLCPIWNLHFPHPSLCPWKCFWVCLWSSTWTPASLAMYLDPRATLCSCSLCLFYLDSCASAAGVRFFVRLWGFLLVFFRFGGVFCGLFLFLCFGFFFPLKIVALAMVLKTTDTIPEDHV